MVAEKLSALPVGPLHPLRRLNTYLVAEKLSALLVGPLHPPGRLNTYLVAEELSAVRVGPFEGFPPSWKALLRLFFILFPFLAQFPLSIFIYGHSGSNMGLVALAMA